MSQIFLILLQIISLLSFKNKCDVLKFYCQNGIYVLDEQNSLGFPLNINKSILVGGSPLIATSEIIGSEWVQSPSVGSVIYIRLTIHGKKISEDYFKQAPRGALGVIIDNQLICVLTHSNYSEGEFMIENNFCEGCEHMIIQTFKGN